MSFQEFYSAHPDALLKINQIYNTHFTGSPLWDLFCDEAIKLEGTWNKSIKLMMDLPLATHRNLIEPLSGYSHIRKFLVKRFLAFLLQIEKSPKRIPRQLLHSIRLDVRSTTGRNLRRIMLATNRDSVEVISPSDAHLINYHQLKEDEHWKVAIIKEVTDIKFGKLDVEKFSIEEIDEMISSVCTS